MQKISIAEDKRTLTFPLSMGDRTQRILVAENDEHIRELLIDLLEARGYHVVSAVCNGQVAITFLKNSGETDLIITDLKMPVLDGVTDGLTLIRWVQNNRPSIPVILVTGNADDEDVCREAREAGACEVIGKPFYPIDILLAAIESALNPSEERRKEN